VVKVKAQKRDRKREEVTPVTKLEGELTNVRRALRTTIRAYAARLEIDLAESIAAVAALKPSLSRQRLHEVRELTTLVRACKVKPDKGRRKDLRKLDTLIAEVHSITHPGASRARR
jgi:hypothetical protein